MDKVAAIHLISGGSAGFVETCVMTPVDLIKVRFQIQRGIDDPTRYSSIFDCARKILKQEGFFSFYKGVLPPILGETPKRAIKFFSFEQYMNSFSSLFPHHNFLVISLSSLCAGVTEGFVSHPFDIVKIQLQSERSKFNVAPSAAQKTKELFSLDEQLGARLRRGLTSVLARNATFNTIYLSVYQNTKQLIPKDTDKGTALLYKFLFGTLGGTVGSICNVPFDVALSRIQSQPFASVAGAESRRASDNVSREKRISVDRNNGRTLSSNHVAGRNSSTLSKPGKRRIKSSFKDIPRNQTSQKSLLKLQHPPYSIANFESLSAPRKAVASTGYVNARAPTCANSLFQPSTVSILQNCLSGRSKPVINPLTMSIARMHHGRREAAYGGVVLRRVGAIDPMTTNLFSNEAGLGRGNRDVPKYRTCLGTISTVYKEEGLMALYKGLLPKIIRLGPGGGLMIIVYEFVNQKLQFLI